MKGQSACQLQDQKQDWSLPVDDFNLPVHAKTKNHTTEFEKSSSNLAKWNVLLSSPQFSNVCPLNIVVLPVEESTPVERPLENKNVTIY